MDQEWGSSKSLALGDMDVTLPIGLEVLTPLERSALTGLADIVASTPGQVTIRRNRRHVVGRWSAGGWTLSVPPAFDARLLLLLVLYSYRLDLNLAKRGKVEVLLERASELDLFLQMIAAVLVAETEEIVATHIAQAYEQHAERSHNPKGRILWRKDFGRHPGDGVSHTHPLKTTDNAVNRLVLAGIRVATTVLGGTTVSGDANRQAFVWRELASATRPRPIDFDRATLRLDRLTEHYRTALLLSRALVLGLTPPDYFADTGDARLPAMQFSLPLIFERFLERLLSEVGATNPRLDVRAQVPDRRALVDEVGATYREVRPDLELYIDAAPALVVDAKFKPQYASGDGSARKMSNADIYQLLFYQARMSDRASGAVVPAAIVAPQLTVEGLPMTYPRQASWRVEGEPDRTVVLLPLPLGPVLDALTTQPAWDALSAAPELRSFLRQHWLLPGRPIVSEVA
jgi:McrBC 5-methylcytosine restriction system component